MTAARYPILRSLLEEHRLSSTAGGAEFPDPFEACQAEVDTAEGRPDTAAPAIDRTRSSPGARPEPAPAFPSIPPVVRADRPLDIRVQDVDRDGDTESESLRKLRDAIIANISHEIRTPLNALLGFAGLLEETLAEHCSDEQREWFSYVEQAGSRLARTVDRLLALSTVVNDSYVPAKSSVDLVACASAVIESLRPTADSKGITLVFDAACPAAVVLADAFSIEQAIVNLVDNAVRFTTDGEVRVHVEIRDGAAYMDIVDSGIGIADEHLPRLFEPFSQEDAAPTRPYQGLGIGMALTRKYLEMNGATISVRTRKSAGTEVELRLPLAPASGSAADVRPGDRRTSCPPDGQRTNIMIVDDDAASRSYLAIVLGQSYAIHCVEDAAAAWRCLQSERIDLVLMDIALGSGEDGLSLTNRIRQEQEFDGVPIIAITAHAFPEDRERCLEAGCHAYVTKPFRRADLEDVIQSALTVRRGS